MSLAFYKNALVGFSGVLIDFRTITLNKKI
jgi:hypothetical protein